MPHDFKVLSIDAERKWEGKHGSFIDYTITVEANDKLGTVVTTRKPESPAPQIGEVIYGHIESEEVPKKDGTTFTKHKLKKDQRPDGVASPSGPQTGATSRVPPPGTTQAAAGPGLTPDQERSRRIERQHSQEMALRAMALIPGRFSDFSVDALRVFIHEWTDHFANDLSPHSPTSTGHPSPQGTGNGGAVASDPPAAAPSESLADKVKDAPAEMSVEQYDEGF